MQLKYILSSLAFLLCSLAAKAQIYGDGLVINEFVASNDSLSGIADPNGQFEDWIELYNGGNVDLNLENFALTDKADNPLKWLFPIGTTLEPDSYLIIWADEDGSQEGLHTNFKLNKLGEFLMLSNPFGEVLDSLTYGPQETNIAYARRPNGTGPFIMQNETFGYNNDEVNAVTEGPKVSTLFTLVPNPARSKVQIKWETGEVPEVKRLEIIDMSGRVQRADLSIAILPPGVYYVRILSDRGVLVQSLVVE